LGVKDLTTCVLVNTRSTFPDSSVTRVSAAITDLPADINVAFAMARPPFVLATSCALIWTVYGKPSWPRLVAVRAHNIVAALSAS
jgi:hypothetical protein